MKNITKELNARQIFVNLKECTYDNTSNERPYRCFRDAPEEINVFTDDSRLHNKNTLFRLEELAFGGQESIYVRNVIGHYKTNLNEGKCEMADERRTYIVRQVSWVW